MKILEKEHCGNHSRVSAKNKEEELPCHVKCNVHKNEDTSILPSTRASHEMHSTEVRNWDSFLDIKHTKK